MPSGQFRVQELNPIMECHLYDTAASLELASEVARRIARMIGRKTSVPGEEGEVLSAVDPLVRCIGLLVNGPRDSFADVDHGELERHLAL